MSETLVVKVGGGAGVDVEAVCQDIAALAAAGQRLVLVHGASAAVDSLASRANVPIRRLQSPSGHTSRYTDPATLEIYVAAAAGQVNKRIVARLQHLGCPALGLSGADGGLLLARRKEAIRVVEAGRQRIVRDDYTGQIESVNNDLLQLLLGAGYLPVVAPLALGLGGELLNIDGDRAAARIAAAAGTGTLIILSNVPGLLAAFPDESSLVRHLTASRMAAAEAMAQGRMKKKVLAAREALEGGVARVVLGDSRLPEPIRTALGGQGTVIDSSPTAGLPSGIEESMLAVDEEA